MRFPSSVLVGPLLRPWLHLYWRHSRGMTLGVRAAVLDAEARVFLVRHTYTPGWHMPGGGVEPGETLLEALAKELDEEANLRPRTEPVLHGMFLNDAISRRDHVAVFVVRDFELAGPRLPDREIAEAGFFPLDALPDGTTRGTRARLAEIREGKAPAQRW